MDKVAGKTDSKPQEIGDVGPLVGKLQAMFMRAEDVFRADLRNDLIDGLTAFTNRYSRRELMSMGYVSQGSDSGFNVSSGLPPVYVSIFSNKATSLISMIMDVFGLGDFPLKPTPIPDLNPAIADEMVREVTGQAIKAAAQQAIASGQAYDTNTLKDQIAVVLQDVGVQVEAELNKKAMTASTEMSKLMADQLVDCQWVSEFRKFIEDLMWSRVAYLKGPIKESVSFGAWVDKGGAWEYKLNEGFKPAIKRVCPFNVRTEPNIGRIEDGYVFEIHKLTRADLWGLKDVEGYSKDRVLEVLRMYPTGYSLNLDTETQLMFATNRSAEFAAGDHRYDAIEFWGYLVGSDLSEWGINVAEDEMEKPFQIVAMFIGDIAFKVVKRECPCELHPYSSASVKPIPDSVAGLSLYQLLSDSMRMANEAARGIMINIPYAAEPMVVINKELFPAGKKVEVHPGAKFEVSPDMYRTGQDPVRFFSQPIIISELVLALDTAQQMASEASGIARMGHGGEGEMKGAGSTATGLSMAMSASSKVIKDMIKSIDVNVVGRRMAALYHYNMLSGPDEVKGDALVMPAGLTSLMSKEVRSMRLREGLETIGGNQTDMSLMGVVGRSLMLIDYINSLELEKSEELADEIEKNVQVILSAPPVMPVAPQPEEKAAA